MRIKSFRADDMRQALTLVRSEMGEDAVVLDTRTVRTAKFLGLGAREQVEVMAAIDEQETPAPPQPDPIPAASCSPRDPVVREKDDPALNVDAVGQLRALRDEVRQLRSMIAPSQAATQDHDDTAALELLNDCGLSAELLSVSRERLAAARDHEGLIDLLSEVLEKHTVPASVDDDPLQRQSVIALVGPTGVGKTTTLAKLAARYALQEGKKVALISCDTFRIGGIEQIRVYARILNVPLEIVASPQDMAAAVEKHADADVILIDTIGRSQRNAPHLEELKELLAPARPTEIYLVVPANTSPDIRMDVVESFSLLSPNRLVISKLDESDSLSCIVTLPIETHLPVACVTTGQNVPDDIEMGDPRTLAGLVAGVAL